MSLLIKEPIPSTPSPALPTRPAKRRRWARWGVAAAALLGIAMFGAWQTRGHDEVAVRPAAPVVDQVQAGEPATADAPVRTRGADAPILYVVSSQEQGEWVRRFSYELGQVSGHPVSVGAVVLTDTADVADLDSLPRGPGTRIFDLR